MGYLRDVGRWSGDNMGGLLEMKVARAADIESIADPVGDTVYGDVTFKTGAGWLTWYGTKGTAGFASRGRRAMEGPEQNGTLEFVLPQDRPDIQRMLTLASYDELVVLYKDGNGRQRLFGSLDSPVRLQYSRATGSRTSARNGYTVEIYAEGPDNCWFYDGTVSSAPAGAAPAVVMLSSGVVLAQLQPGDEYIINSPFTIGIEMNDESTMLTKNTTAITANESIVT